VDISFKRFPPQGTPAAPEASLPASDSSPVPA
jgi:hypothetical protein